MAEFSGTVNGVKAYPWVRMAAMFVTLWFLLLIPMKIIGYGYMPSDDALRHAAKAVTGRPWTEILVVRDGLTLDSHPGWHAVLGFFHRALDAGPEALTIFAVVVLCMVFLLAPPLFLARVETWAMALSLMFLADMGWSMRLLLGRPFILTMTAVALFCLLSKRLSGPRTHWGALTALAVAVGLSVWLNCTWYLWALPVAAMVLARQWRGAFRTAAAVSAGVLFGACLSGQPVVFLWQNVHHVILTMGNNPLTRQLVTELQPTGGDYQLLILPAFFLLWRRVRGKWHRSVWDNPVFLMAAMCWGLGLFVGRFWIDWGTPALAVWIALEFQPVVVRHFPRMSLRRLVLAGAASVCLMVMATRDIGGRWTAALSEERLSLVDADDPSKPSDYADWLPQPGGILYSASMGTFYSTFYANPDAKWRYILGFEPGWMPQDDLEIYRKIQWNFGASKAYAPWVKKMRPEDRLAIGGNSGAKPEVPGLEWKYAVSGMWLGRLPQKSEVKSAAASAAMVKPVAAAPAATVH